jgi:hypothetical protein
MGQLNLLMENGGLFPKGNGTRTFGSSVLMTMIQNLQARRQKVGDFRSWKLFERSFTMANLSKADETVPELKRLQLEMTEDRLKYFDKLVVECGLRTRKDLFDNAMTLLDWALEEIRSGNKIACVNQEDKRMELLRMPIFDHVKQHSELTRAVPASDPVQPAGNRKNPRLATVGS